MEVKERHFGIQLTDGTETPIPAAVDCQARYWNEGGYSHRVCRIKLSYNDTELEGSDRDFFEAFCRVREQLEGVGLLPLCYGTSRNVYPSGMQRDMGDGLSAYRMRMGRETRRGGSVLIFNSGEDIDPVSVKEQKEFVEAWRKSVMGQPPPPDKPSEPAAE